MDKSDLRTGMRVLLNNGRLYDVFLGVKNSCYESEIDLLMQCNGEEHLSLRIFGEDFNYYCDTEYNIQKIYEPIQPISLKRQLNSKYWNKVWERTSKKMTIKEVEELLGYNIEIID